MHADPPTLLFFLPDLNGGGAERALLNLLSAWPSALREKWRPVLAVRNLSGPLVEWLPEWLDVYALGLPRTGLLSSVQTVWRLARLVRRLRPAAVLPFLSFPSVVLATRVAGTGSRLIASLQNPPLATLADPSTAPFLRSRLARAVNRWAYRQIDLALPIAPGIGRQLCDHFGVDPGRIRVVANSVRLDAVHRAARRPLEHFPACDPQARVVLTACRLVPQKRVDILLRAGALLAQRMPLCLIILGDGPQRPELASLAESLGMGACTHFAGFQKNPWQWMAHADLFALTSDYEGFGNVLIEALACGVPVVSTRAPFGPEYILGDTEAGVLVPPGDPEALAAALEMVLSDADLRRHLSANGRKRAAAFDVTPVFGTFWQAIEPFLCT